MTLALTLSDTSVVGRDAGGTSGVQVKMVTALLFDLYETLVTERGTSPTRASSLGERLGLDDGAYRRAWRAQRIRVIRGEISLNEALSQIAAALGSALDQAVVAELCEQRCREKTALLSRFDENAAAALHRLHTGGVKLAVVSNCFAEDVQGWPRCRAAEWFDASVFSFDVGIAKPAPQIYLEALRRLGVEKASAVFVGDGGDDELLGAERAGLRAAQASWFRGALVGLPAHIPRLSSWQAVLDLASGG